MIAEKLVREAEKVDRAVGHLLDAAAAGDLAAAKALIPYFDQALGKPTERHELRVPSSVEEIEQLSTEELASRAGPPAATTAASGCARRFGLASP